MPATKVDVLIVLSGLLVLVSIVLLVLGLADEDSLTLVYFSIGTSVVAGVLLILGALQRRGETPAAADASASGGSDTSERVTTVSVTRPTVTTPGDETAAMPAAAAGGPTVSVVPGRPRYHVAGCRFLSGRDDVTEMSLDDAKSGSYTACGVCKPDDALAGYPAPAASDADGTDDPEVESLLETPAERERTRAAATGRAAKSTASAGRAAAARTPAVKAAPARPAAATTPAKSAAKAAPTRAAAAKAAPAKAATRAAAPAKAATATRASASKSAPAKSAPAKSAPAKAAPAKATKAAPAKATGTTVVVIPDRDKFHTEACRFVKGVAGTVSVAKATARRQGYEPCGVCKP
jgi:hypothetical protein